MIAALARYWHWVVIGLLVLLAQQLHLRNLGLQRNLADAGRQAAELTASRESAARAHETQLAKREQQHAADQQTKEENYAKDKESLGRQLVAEQRTAGRLRDQLAYATARGRSGDPTDAVACQRTFDRLEALGGLAGEGVELLVEGRGLLQQRDLDVQRLLDQVTLDRQACEGEVQASE
ncbi:hypothetical protein Daci_3453 [Delftia acidovorans SPH-1]|uniref:Uncharacterized protein n=1 Tax=Delftia acidovorans (strain DSM 14801 / SPH-1) TaxID=398578 RepID=A9C2E5_DELAS|nr:hypothetical protein [Delftia acidovorans]ABX36089.1 hypothetical protein Daci_3453 [Delftia acidovorans SPH-1]QPS74622.1 hypothetical protein I6G48_29130 [Delftia acidovorans]